MSRVRAPQDEWSRINDLERRITAIERGNALQGTTASAIDSTGQTRLLVGQLSPGVWGVGLFDASGNELVQLDSTGLRSFDSAGRTMTQLDATGLRSFDTSGHTMTQLDQTGLREFNAAGTTLTQIDASGLRVRNAAGVLQAVAGVVVAGFGNLSTAATTAQLISGTVATATVGSSGQALVTLVGTGEMNGPSTGGGSAFFAVGADGATPTSAWSQLQTNLAAAQLTAPISAARLFTGLSAGSHTFGAYVWSDSASHSAILDSAYVIVQPL